MINIEIDGKLVETAKGSTVMDAAHKAGVYIPHFCYHKKLSISANCRMCLVEVEKAPKPLPACATPAAEGMKVHTHSEMAAKAQKGVMEFLLINHPLDCPICDQGGECQLQDVAMGYGGGASRYTEEKRVVSPKQIGELISTNEMSRCIQCTRCVRFGQEIAGVMELGMANRSEFSQIMSFVNSSVDSELSGNMIDLCPVGALTSKPFRYTARSWELSRRKSVSPHDSLGSNLAVHVKDSKVLRVVPVENEQVNECWISDKDRFSYEGLNSAERLTRPMIKQDNKWIEVDWPAALEYVANGLSQITRSAGANQIAALATPTSTFEELYLLQKLMRAIGSDNVDYRLRQSDFSADGMRAGSPWLGMSVASLNSCDRFLVIGSFLRKDHPLIAQRIRQAVKSGAQFNFVHSSDDELLMAVANKEIVAPDQLVSVLEQILKALAIEKKVVAPVDVASTTTGRVAIDIAKNLASGKQVGIFLGNFAQQHPQAVRLAYLAEQIAILSTGKVGYFGEGANSVGAHLAGAVPFSGKHSGLNATAMLESPRKAYLLLNVEPELDMHNPQLAMRAMKSADMVVCLSAFKHQGLDYADVMLPIAPFTETSGTFINTEGRAQSFKGATKPLGEARPAWKVLRVLANVLDLPGFEFDSSESVRDEGLDLSSIAERLDNHLPLMKFSAVTPVLGMQRVADVPIYATDAVVRRATALQKTNDAAAPFVMITSVDMHKLGLQPGDAVKVTQGSACVELSVRQSEQLAAGTVRLAAGIAETAMLGAMFGTIELTTVHSTKQPEHARQVAGSNVERT